MKGLVNKIIPFSSVDGPGNRTAIFLQGCNINCKYCHNPETRGLCTNCGLCVSHCPAGALTLDADNKVVFCPEKCLQCDACLHICPHDSSPRTMLLTPLQTYQKVAKQIPFIRGITVSGGECMLQAEFVRQLFELAKADGLSTLMDSNGTIAFWQYPRLMEVTDGVMLDIKAFDSAQHQKVTDADNAIVLQNAIYLAQTQKLQEVRAVIVPQLYDVQQSVSQMGKFLLPLLQQCHFAVKIIAYRPFGVRKQYANLQVPDQSLLNNLKNVLLEQGFEDVTVV